MSINIKPLSISDLLNNSETHKLIIPLYQRAYSWGTAEVNKFLSDFDTLQEPKNDIKQHFIGLIVLCPHGSNSNTSEYEIIDGQQRLTTISIFISILRDLLKDFSIHNEVKSDSSLLDEVNDQTSILSNCLARKKELKLITQNESKFESEFLTSILNKITELEQYYVGEYDSQNSDEKNTFKIKSKYLTSAGFEKIWKSKNSYIAYKTIYDYIQEKISVYSSVKMKCNKLIELSTLTLEKLKIIPFVSDNLQEAYTLFETLNDRGLELAAIDLIKNLCISKVDNVDRKMVHDLWTKIFTEILQKKDATTFMRYAYNSKYTFARKNNLYSEFDSQIKKIHSSPEIINFLNGILKDAENFETLKSSTHEKNKINNIINLLRTSKSIQWYSIGLAVLRIWDFYENSTPSKNKLTDPIVELLEKTHEIIFYIVIKKGKTNLLETFLPLISRELDESLKQQNIDDVILAFKNSKMKIEQKIIEEDLKINRNDLTSYSTKSNENSKLFLNYLRYKKTKNGTLYTEAMTLEHVYPQNPKANEWNDFMNLQQEEKEKYCSQLGNHLLLTSAPNKSLQNKEYKIKKDKYENVIKPEDLVDDHSLNYITNDTWTIDLIEKRTNNIYTQLINFLGI